MKMRRKTERKGGSKKDENEEGVEREVNVNTDRKQEGKRKEKKSITAKRMKESKK